MDDNRDWPTLIEKYLAACYEDLKTQARLKLDNALSQVINQYASAMIVDLYHGKIETAIAEMKSYPSANSWRIVEENPRRVLVEVPKSESYPLPFLDTRFLLVKPRDSWQIHDILEQCLNCGLRKKGRPGTCELCDGTGKLWFNQNSICRFCNGTGACKKCEAETAPGWCRAIILDPDR